jgi:hypothetical protein
MTLLKIIILMTVVSHHWHHCLHDIQSNGKPGEQDHLPIWKFVLMLWIAMSIPLLYTFELLEVAVA